MCWELRPSFLFQYHSITLFFSVGRTFLAHPLSYDRCDGRWYPSWCHWILPSICSSMYSNCIIYHNPKSNMHVFSRFHVEINWPSVQIRLKFRQLALAFEFWCYFLTFKKKLQYVWVNQVSVIKQSSMKNWKMVISCIVCVWNVRFVSDEMKSVFLPQINEKSLI